MNDIEHCIVEIRFGLRQETEAFSGKDGGPGGVLQFFPGLRIHIVNRILEPSGVHRFDGPGETNRCGKVVVAGGVHRKVEVVTCDIPKVNKSLTNLLDDVMVHRRDKGAATSSSASSLTCVCRGCSG